MNELNAIEVRYLKNTYLPGTLIELLNMDDIQSPPAGTKGKVLFVDDIGQIHVKWSNGSSLALIPNLDSFKVLEYGDDYDNGD